MVADVTGWSQLMAGNITEAAYVGYNDPLQGYLLLLVFCVVEAILFLNSGVEISFIMGIIFFGAFSVGPSIAGTAPWLNTYSVNIILIILAVQLASVFYKLIVKT